MSLNSIVEFMLDEDFNELDEMSKDSFGSYIRSMDESDAELDESDLSQDSMDESVQADQIKSRVITDPIAFYASKLTANLIKE